MSHHHNDELEHYHNHNHDHDHDEDDHYYDNTYLHDNQHVFLKHYLEMVKTCKIGFSYIRNKMNNNEFDQNMVRDCIMALKAIEEANFLAWNVMKTIDQQAYDNIRAFDAMLPNIVAFIQAQEQNNQLHMKGMFVDTLSPAFEYWSDSVENAIQPHIPK